MMIHLNEVPSEGRSYDFSRKTGELNDDLRDLIGENDYKVHLDILPVGRSFDVNGKIEASFTETCSFCANEFSLSVKEKFHELVVHEAQKHLKGFDEKWTPNEEVGVSVIEDPNEFNVGMLIHEVLALAEPVQPICRQDCKGLCTHCGQDLNETTCNCAQQQKTNESPFSVLKRLKLN